MIPKFREPIVYVDVDDTLIAWKTDVLGDFQIDDLEYNMDVVRHIMRHKICDHTVIVWSAGGADWAEKVVKHIGIEHLVDAVMAKPTWYVDDKPASHFMHDNMWNTPEKIRGDK